MSHLCVRALRHLPQVVLRSCGDATEEDLLSDTAAERHAHPVHQLLLGVEVLLFWEVLRVAQTFTTWDDGHLKRRRYNIIKMTRANKRTTNTKSELIGTFNRGSACSRYHPATACPASWYATVFFSSGCSTCVFFSKPTHTHTQHLKAQYKRHQFYY